MKEYFFDLYKNLLYNNEIIRVIFRLSLIKIFLEKLSRIEFKIFYDISIYENPFRTKFPNLIYLDYYDYKEFDIVTQEKLTDEIQEKISDHIEEIGNLYYDVIFNLSEKINIKYYKL